MLKYLKINLLFLVLISCKPIQVGTNTVTKDSIITKVVERTITKPGDTVKINHFIKCPDGKVPTTILDIQKTKGITHTEVKLDSGKLEVVSNCDSVIQKKDSLINQLKSVTTVTTKTIEVKTSYWYDKYIGRPLIGILLLIIVIGVVKFYLKFQIPFLK